MPPQMKGREAAFFVTRSAVWLASAILLLCSPELGEPARAEENREATARNRCLRAGEIFILGNCSTPQEVILRQLPFRAGDRFTLADLRTAERNLARLKILSSEFPPSVTTFDNGHDPASGYKDIQVVVTETPSCIYYWAAEDSMAFADTWRRHGFPAAALASRGSFPRELICFALTGELSQCPCVIYRFFPEKWTRKR